MGTARCGQGPSVVRTGKWALGSGSLQAMWPRKCPTIAVLVPVAALLWGTLGVPFAAAAGPAIAAPHTASQPFPAGARLNALPALPKPLLGSRPERLTSTNPPYTATLQVPEVVWPGHDAIALRVDGAIDAWVQGQVQTFSTGVTQDLKDAKTLPARLPASSLSIAFRISEFNAAVASFRFTVEPFFRGAANFGQTPGTLSFDMQTGQPYTLSSLFKPGTAFLPLLARATLAGLKAFHPASHCDLGSGGPPPKAASFEAWSLSAGGLVLSFPAGDYTAAYCGVPAITVPAKALAAVARKGGPLAP